MNNSILYKRAQLPALALLVGIDTHKKQHTVSLCSPDLHVLSQFKIRNGRSGFDELLTRTQRCLAQQGLAAVVFAIEPAGHYWRTLAAYLSQAGQTWRLINPFTLKRQRDGEDLNHQKNDERDATMAAELLREGKYTWSTLPQGVYAELYRAHVTYQQVLNEHTRAKLQLTAALDLLFPEFRTAFKDLAGRTALTVLRQGANPHQLAGQPLETFLTETHQSLQAQGQRRCPWAKLRQLHALAQCSAGVAAEASALTQQVQLLAERLSMLVAQRQRAEQWLRHSLDQCPEKAYLLSLRGLGEIQAAGLLAHIGDIRHFSGVKQLTKLAGINPTEHASGASHGGRTPMSKKGRSGLREVCYRAVVGLLRHNAVFQRYVQGLQARPVHPLNKREAIGAAMNKLLRVVYALVSQQQCYAAERAQFG